MTRLLPSPYQEAVTIAQLVHELADYTQRLESIVKSVADGGIHVKPTAQDPCSCSKCQLIREARAVLEARRRKAKEGE